MVSARRRLPALRDTAPSGPRLWRKTRKKMGAKDTSRAVREDLYVVPRLSLL